MKPSRDNNAWVGIYFGTAAEIEVLSHSVNTSSHGSERLKAYLDVEISRLLRGDYKRHPTTDALGVGRYELILPTEFACEAIMSIVSASKLGPTEADRVGINRSLADAMIQEYWGNCDLSLG